MTVINMIFNLIWQQTCRIWGFHSSTDEYSSHLRCYALQTCKQLPTYRRLVTSSTSRSRSQRKHTKDEVHRTMQRRRQNSSRNLSICVLCKSYGLFEQYMRKNFKRVCQRNDVISFQTAMGHFPLHTESVEMMW